MVRLFHGSTSASFVGVLHKDSPGLTHMQSLLDIGLVPYCGELNNMGIAPGGISYLGISAVHHGRLFRALEYAERGLRSSWDPQVGRDNCETLERKIGEERQREEAWVHQLSVPILQQRLVIERLRITHWGALRRWEQRWVEQQFPVIYSFNHKGETINVVTDTYGEVGVPVPISVSKLRIYVPEKRMARVRKVAPQVEVLPCEALKKEGVDVRNKKAVDNFLGQLAYFYGPKYNRWIPAKAI
ncbi:MAG TPA: hypothetical protein VJB87_04135 [Candidatus Nanoarchaeia archaeon]|nr:hypothetical protein [Candidatus Nanoarchaeia archaeon]